MIDMKEKGISFRIAIVWTILFAFVLYGTSVIVRKLPVDFTNFQFIPGLFAALAALVFAIFIEMRFSQVSIAQALKKLGFKLGDRRQYQLTLIGAIPIFVAYLVIVFFIGKSAALEQGAIFLLLKLTISQGLIEEAVFRGLIFRHLRVRTPFWTAAFLSGILFALIHVVNLAKGVSAEILIALGTSITFGFILTFPLAILFEIGGGSILAGAFLHLLIDSINCFKEVGEPGAPMNTYLFSLIILSVVIVGLALRNKRFCLQPY